MSDLIRVFMFGVPAIGLMVGFVFVWAVVVEGLDHWRSKHPGYERTLRVAGWTVLFLASAFVVGVLLAEPWGCCT